MDSQPCVQCKERPALEGYPTPLCTECRHRFIHYPIPLWIKLFAAGLLLVVVFACFSLPRQLTVGVHMARGERAERERRYHTALREFQMADKYLHDNIALNCRLYICAVYDGQTDLFPDYWKRIDGKMVDNETLHNEVTAAEDQQDYYMVSNTVVAMKKRHPEGVPDSAYLNVIRSDAKDWSARFAYASTLYDQGRFDSCMSILDQVLNQDVMNIQALALASWVEVERKKPDSAIYYCDRLLVINGEDAMALAGKARNLLRLGRYDEAVEPAVKAYRLADTSSYMVATMALLYHFNGQKDKMNQMTVRLAKFTDTADRVNARYATDVIAGKEPFSITQ